MDSQTGTDFIQIALVQKAGLSAAWSLTLLAQWESRPKLVLGPKETDTVSHSAPEPQSPLSLLSFHAYWPLSLRANDQCPSTPAHRLSAVVSPPPCHPSQIKGRLTFSPPDLPFSTTFSPWKWKVKVAHFCPTLFDPMNYKIHGILEARVLECVAFPFSTGSSQPRDQTQVSCIAGRFFTSWATGEVQEYWCG